MSTVEIGLSEEDIDYAIRRTVELQYEFEEKLSQIEHRLSIIGWKVAKASFDTAIYDGDNDVKVSVGYVNAKYLGHDYVFKAVTAKGEAVLFIEYGTGVRYNTPDPHPYRVRGVCKIGEYGLKKGKHKAWVYRGNPGSNGEVLKNGNVLTRGNPANMCMWKAYKQMVMSVEKIVREVFTDDKL